MDENVIEIIRSFKETKKAIDEFVPLLMDYSAYSENVKNSIDIIRKANIDESNNELKFSINKLEKVQKDIEKNISDIQKYNDKYSQQVDEFEKKLDSKIKEIENKNEQTINKFEEKLEKIIEKKLEQIISLINSISNEDSITLKNIEDSIKTIEEAFE